METSFITFFRNVINENILCFIIEQNGLTALHKAACCGELEVVKYLLSCKAIVDKADNVRLFNYNEVVVLVVWRHLVDYIGSTCIVCVIGTGW